MPPDIPDYYRHLATPSDKEADSSNEDQARKETRGMPIPESARRPKKVLHSVPTQSFNQQYRTNWFTIGLFDDWTDRTVFTLTGPVTDGIQHNITITRQADLPTDKLLDFAELQIQSLEDSLKGCRLLLKEPILMADSRDAYRAIFVWWPTEDLRIYQEQIYILHEQTGFTLTASFSKKTRKTIGPEIERSMLSFSPGQ